MKGDLEVTRLLWRKILAQKYALVKGTGFSFNVNT